jgi:hypothetical protein
MGRKEMSLSCVLRLPAQPRRLLAGLAAARADVQLSSLPPVFPFHPPISLSHHSLMPSIATTQTHHVLRRLQ